MERLEVVGEWILGEVAEKDEMTSGGVYLPKTAKNPEERKTKRATIIGIGEKVENHKFSVGDEVVIYFEAGLECEKFGHLFKEANIMAIIRKEEPDV